jgi:hypothetical protein
MSNDSDSEEMSTTKKAQKSSRSKKKNEEVSIRTLMFSGKKKDWVHWEEKFLAKA